MKLFVNSIRKVSAVLFALLLGLSPMLAISAFAEGGASSPYGNYTVYNTNYKNVCSVYAGLYNGVPYANAGTTVYTESSSVKVPSGYMGAKARVFDSSDKLVAETGYVYNNKETYYVDSDTAKLNNATKNAAYYSYGITAGYNGNGYSTYYTYKSPSQNAS